MKKPLFFSILAALLIAFTLLSLMNLKTAHAQPLSLQTLQCTGNEVTTFSPALTNTVQPYTFASTLTLGTAASPVGTCLVIGAPITGGTEFHQRTFTTSCDSLLHPTPVTETLTWNTGATSTIDFTTSENNSVEGETVITRIGRVTDGFGQGNSAVETVTEETVDVTACFTTGLTSLSGQITLTFA